MKHLLMAFFYLGSIFLNAAPSQQGFIKVPGGQLYYQQFGLSKNKLPIIVLHGGPGMDQSYLLPQMAQLAKDREVIFYDQRGAGKSSILPLAPDQITMERYVQDLEAVRKYFGFQKIILLGHSWGALLAAEYATAYPQHVAGFIFLNSIPMTSQGFQLFQNEFVRRVIPLQKQLDTLQQSPKFQAGDPKTTADFYRLTFSIYCARPQDADKITLSFTPTSALNAEKIEGIFTRNFLMSPYDLHPQLHELAIPTLIIHGAQDIVPLSTAFETNVSMPSSTMILLDRCGHFSYVEQKKKCFGAIKKFLKNL